MSNRWLTFVMLMKQSGIWFGLFCGNLLWLLVTPRDWWSLIFYATPSTIGLLAILAGAVAWFSPVNYRRQP